MLANQPLLIDRKLCFRVTTEPAHNILTSSNREQEVHLGHVAESSLITLSSNVQFQTIFLLVRTKGKESKWVALVRHTRDHASSTGLTTMHFPQKSKLNRPKASVITTSI